MTANEAGWAGIFLGFGLIVGSLVPSDFIMGLGAINLLGFIIMRFVRARHD